MAESDTEKVALVKKDDAILGATISAAVAAAGYGLRKALAEGRGGHPGRDHEDERGETDSNGSLLVTVWESASSAVLPLAEDAAAAAGKWVADNAPEVVRRRIIPRFIGAFQDAA